MLQNDLWGYVYIPSLDLYGWLLCSYITEYSSISKPETTAKDEETKASKNPETTTEASTEKVSLHHATVTAEKGLYLRRGPGTDYEAIYIASHGETVTVLDKEENDGWIYVSINDKTGYMNKTFLSDESL